MDAGSKSGWMYRLNGEIPNTYMGAHTLNNGDSVEVFFTNDYTQESGGSIAPQKTGSSSRKDTALPFDDISQDAWYLEDVKYVCENGLMQGVTEKKFAPYQTATRAMVCQILYNMENKPAAAACDYADVSQTSWYAPAVNWATQAGLVNGCGDGTFAPNDKVTREQLATILLRCAEGKGNGAAVQGSLNRFADSGKISAWARTGMAWAVGTKLMQGDGNGALNPNAAATRAEIAALFHRFLGLLK